MAGTEEIIEELSVAYVRRKRASGQVVLTKGVIDPAKFAEGRIRIVLLEIGEEHVHYALGDLRHVGPSDWREEYDTERRVDPKHVDQAKNEINLWLDS